MPSFPTEVPEENPSSDDEEDQEEEEEGCVANPSPHDLRSLAKLSPSS